MPDWFRLQPKIPAKASSAPPPLPTTGAPAAKPAWSKSTMPTALPDNKAGVSAKVVMQHFARSEVRNLDKGSSAVHEALVEKLRKQPEFYLMSADQLSAVIQQMASVMQSADLTINFKCMGWFDKPNTYPSYTQMYERGVRKVKGPGGTEDKLLVGNASNDAISRDKADTAITFGANINDPSREGIARFMQTGGLTQVGQRGNMVEARVGNDQFNPRAKPIFAGLNIGRRPHGANTYYGLCHLVLNKHFKANAIYYMGDTFLPGQDHTKRITYGMLPALMLHTWTKESFVELINATYRNMTLSDTGFPDRLVEAHIYGEITFKQGVEAVVVSRRDMENTVGGLRLNAALGDDPTPLDKLPTLIDIEHNVRVFAKRNDVKIRWVE